MRRANISVLAIVLLSRAAVAGTFSVGGEGAHQHAVAIDTQGRLLLWGSGYGIQGYRDTTLGVTAVSVGAEVQDTICVLRQDGTVWCQGDSQGYIAGGVPVDGHFHQIQSVTDPIAQMSSGRDSSCAVTTGGELWCWGSNAFSKGGLPGNPGLAWPWKLTTIQGVAHVVVGPWSACAIKTDGTLWCWGENDYGQLGDGTTNSSSTPLPVAALGNDVAEAAVGDGFICARKSDGTVWCWGRNDAGQLGIGNTTASGSPQEVTALGAGVLALAAGYTEACVIAADRTVWCWGGSWPGDGSSQGSVTPVQAEGLQQVAELSLSYNVCARTTSSAIWCWDGANPNEVLGGGTLQSDGTFSISPSGRLPVLVPFSVPSVPAGNAGWCAAVAVALTLVAGAALRLRRS